MKITTSDGKYTFETPPSNNWHVMISRCNEEGWILIENGHNAIAALMHDLFEARNLIEMLKGDKFSLEEQLEELKGELAAERDT